MFPCPDSVHILDSGLESPGGRTQPLRMDPHNVRVASTQGGAFTGHQAREQCRWEQLQKWQGAGLVVRESRTVFRLSDAADALPDRFARAELRIGRPLIACHNTAAELFAFGILPDGKLHVTTPDARSINAPPAMIVHQMTLRSPAARAAGCAATDPADTAVDLAAAAKTLVVLAVLDAALRAGVPRDRIGAAVTKASSQRGIVEVRRQLPFANASAASPMESRSRFRVREAGLPEPELQIPVPVDAGGYRMLDMGWRKARVGLEFDGQDFHSGDGSLDNDRQRATELLDAGWVMVHITARDVYRNPERFTGVLRRLLRDRGC